MSLQGLNPCFGKQIAKSFHKTLNIVNYETTYIFIGDSGLERHLRHSVAGMYGYFLYSPGWQQGSGPNC